MPGRAAIGSPRVVCAPPLATSGQRAALIGRRSEWAAGTRGGKKAAEPRSWAGLGRPDCES